MASPGKKPEFPPLLGIGRHLVSIDEVLALCVKGFPKSTTRLDIMDGFMQVARRLNSARIQGELWLDGSYLTSKIDPEDIDVVLRMESAFVDACTPEQLAAIDWVASDLHDSHRTHSFVLTQWPKGHPLYWHGEYGYAYWMRQWGL